MLHQSKLSEPRSTELKVISRKIGSFFLLAAILILGHLFIRDTAWQGAKQLHTIMEVIATFLSLMVGITALLRYYSKRNNTFLFVGTGFFGTALLDGYHAIVTSTFFRSIVAVTAALLDSLELECLTYFSCPLDVSKPVGVAGYIIKPTDYKQFLKAVKTIELYWSLSELPQ